MTSKQDNDATADAFPVGRVGVMRKDDVQTSYHQGTEGLPMVNVKDRSSYAQNVEALRYALVEHSGSEVVGSLAEDAAEWASQYPQEHWHLFAAEDCWEAVQERCEEVFGTETMSHGDGSTRHPKYRVWSAGRSAGWACVEGLPRPESWDAITLAKWGRFARLARADADRYHELVAWYAAESYLAYLDEVELGI